MKNATKLLFLTMLTFFTFSSTFGQGSEKYSVIIDVTVDADEPSITLNFNWVTDASSYDIFRKDFEATSWTTLGSITSGNSYTDKTVSKGKMYEYYMKKNSNAGTTGYGFVTTGIEVPAIHNRGAVLLLIDSTIHADLATKLDTLRMDIAGDGYEIIEFAVPPSMDHIALKSKIAEFQTLYQSLEYIYILGHVAVPYSGTYCEDSYWVVPPDGHKEGSGNHCGAWAADVYYAVPEGTWTDTKTVEDGTRTFTKNLPGDGKFDQIVLPGKVEYGLGRVDLSNMTKFTKSELELTRQYIDKAHRYRHGISKPVMKTLVDENFGANANEQFASSGYRFFGAVAGKDNVFMQDFISTLKDSQYIFAYGTGPGSYTSAGGIGKTDDFVTNQGAAYFNMLFGSFFGNWDNANNFLRAPLAVENGGLTNAWAGRPAWHFYPMALNQSTGYCARLTQNNKTLYPQGYFNNQVHVALMGDPTLRMHMFAPPSNVSVSTSNANQTVDLTWTASTDQVDGYNIYYSKNMYGPYTRANTSLITGTSYSHTAPHNGKVYYMVRAERLETTHAGSFYNLSQGSFGEIDNLINTSVETILAEVNDLKVFPNPASDAVQVSFNVSDGDGARLALFDAQGRLITSKVIEGNGTLVEQFDVSALSSGLYLVKVNNATRRILVK